AGEYLVRERWGTEVRPGPEHGVAPAGVVGLEPVVPATQRTDVVTRRRSVLGVGDHVVQVAAPRRAGAPREHTGLVPLRCLGGDPVGDLVLLHVHVFAQVD